MDNIALAMAMVAALGVAAHWLAWRFHLPAIITLLVTGFVLGPVFHLVNPMETLGPLMRPLISVAVAIILFEGGLHLRFETLHDAQKSVRRLIVLGAPIGWILISAGLHWITQLSWAVSVTFGGLLVVTGPTVIMPLLRSARLKARVSSLLKWEGIVNDPIGALFAVVSFEFFTFMQNDAHGGMGSMVGTIAFLLLIISVITILVSRVMVWLFEHGHVPEYLKKPFLLAVVIGLYVFANFLQDEGGLLAVTIMGMTLANNSSLTSIEELRRFKESMAVILVAGVFIILTANLDITLFYQMDWRDAAFVLALLFVIRPLTVFASTAWTGLPWQEKLLVGWIAPRGVVCVAIAGLFGPLLVAQGYADGEKVVPLAFLVVIVTVILHGFTLRYLGRKLGLVHEKANGVILVGVHDWTIQLAESLTKIDIPVIMADRNWIRLKKARLRNLNSYFGEILSEETEYVIDLAQYRYLLAATDNPAYNALVCSKFAHELGRDNVYQLSIPADDEKGHRSIARTVSGRRFVHQEMGFYEIWDMFRSGWRFKATPLSEDFNFNKFCETNPDSIVVGSVNEKGALRFTRVGAELKPKPDEILLSFIFKQPENTSQEE